MRASFLDSLGMSTNAAVSAIGSPRKSSTPPRVVGHPLCRADTESHESALQHAILRLLVPSKCTCPIVTGMDFAILDGGKISVFYAFVTINPTEA